MKAERDVVVDLSQLDFADASLMLDLAALARRLRRHDGVLWLRDPQPQIKTLIELVGVHRLDAINLQEAAPALT